MCLLSTLLILCLHIGGFCKAFYIGQSVTVDYGDSVVLPCDGSALIDEGVTFHWETMGTDVVVPQEGEYKIGPSFEGRIQFLSEEEISKGNWSVILTQAKLRDSSMYECIWQERRTLSAVWVTVQEPHVETSRTVHVGTWVELPCYIESTRTPSNYLEVQWTKDGNHFASREDNVQRLVRSGIRLVKVSEEEFRLKMTTTMADSGKYECWYKTRSSDYLRNGHPESITLTVLQENTVESVSEHDETSTDMFDYWVPSTPSYTEPWTEVQTQTTQTTQTQTTVEILPVYLTDPTQPMEVTTEPQPMEAFEETMTSFPNEGTPETTTSSSFQWDNLPWVRIGLIGGVLLVTCVVLCILGALSKI